MDIGCIEDLVDDVAVDEEVLAEPLFGAEAVPGEEFPDALADAILEGGAAGGVPGFGNDFRLLYNGAWLRAFFEQLLSLNDNFLAIGKNWKGLIFL